MAYRIAFTSTATQALRRITDRRTQEAIVRRIETLAYEPERQGKALRGELSSFLSMRAAGQRYRVIYRVEQRDKVVIVALVGLRREGSRQDVYALAARLVRRGLI